MPRKVRPKDIRCQYKFTDGRRCRLNRADGHASLCLKHWRSDQAAVDSESESSTPQAAAIVSRALGFGPALNNAHAINDVITKLVRLRARKLISARDAHLIAYISQLALMNLDDFHNEFLRLYDWHEWDKLLSRTDDEIEANNTAAREEFSADGETGSGEESSPASAPKPSRSARPKRRRKPRPFKVPATAKEFAGMVLDRAVEDGLITQKFLDREKQRRQGARSEPENEEASETEEENQEYVAPEA